MDDAAILPTALSISHETIELKLGDTFALSAVIAPEDCSNANVTWGTSDARVAEVNLSGLVRAISGGEATIYAWTENGITAHCDVVVLPVLEPKKIRLIRPVASMLDGQTVQITAALLPEGVTETTLTWTSSDETVAVVDETGAVTGVGEGTAVITAETVNHLSASHIVCVSHDWGEPVYTWAEDMSTVTAMRPCRYADAHNETETVAVTSEITKDPTCETKGETTYTSAAFENEVFTVQTKILQDIPSLGHDWDEVTYTWSEDNASVTALRTCERDSEHEETETVVTAGEITKAATCEAMGETMYTSAAFGNEAFTIQTKTLEDVPALGHNWGEVTYTWSEDNMNVTAMHICERDNAHVEDETVAAMITLGRAPTDTGMGETLFTAVFSNEAFGEITKTVADIPALKDLSLLRLPSMLKEIDREAFMGFAVEGVIIPEGCTAIGSRAFAECPKLVYIRIPASVTSIADDAFEGSDYVRIDRGESDQVYIGPYDDHD